MPFLPVCAVRPKFCAAWNVPSRCLARCLRCSSRSLQPGRAAPRHCNQPALCQRDVTGLEAHQPRALAEGHTAKTAQDFCCRDMEAISLCVPFAATRTRTGEVVLVPQDSGADITLVVCGYLKCLNTSKSRRSLLCC